MTEAVTARVTAKSERCLRAGLSTERRACPAAEAAVAAVYRAGAEVRDPPRLAGPLLRLFCRLSFASSVDGPTTAPST
ncbi:hypothetical protein [Streptomyces europaeiscabiei]|uniref:hypothetical protein n=1 Tax=Streptomyces europaeiscabiei TaxID=146819 RepID=UPI002E1107EF|nr:hypothetical protein OHB30_04920 [Streptomyces europaeiscabiei]